MLSFGAGQDSTAILYLLGEVAEFRKRYAPGDLVVAFSDTGDEFPMTYMNLLLVKQYCRSKGIEFVHIKPEMGFHTPAWQSLTDYFRKYNVVMSKFFRKSCTDSLKIQPIYRWLNAHVAKTYGYQAYGKGWLTKFALANFVDDNGKIDVLIGIAKGEEKRITPDEKLTDRWLRHSIRRVYPLVALGWGRAECQQFLRDLGVFVPPPSNCMRCPFMSLPELLYLARKFPAQFVEWVGFEAAKLRKFAHKGEKNYGVLHKTKRLPEMLADAERLYGHWSLERLEEYRFSHGHCVQSKY